MPDTFFRAARRLDEKTARGLFGDDGDKEALRLLALEYSKTALAFVVNLPEIQIRELASLGSLDREALYVVIIAPVKDLLLAEPLRSAISMTTSTRGGRLGRANISDLILIPQSRFWKAIYLIPILQSCFSINQN